MVCKYDLSGLAAQFAASIHVTRRDCSDTVPASWQELQHVVVDGQCLAVHICERLPPAQELGLAFAQLPFDRQALTRLLQVTWVEAKHRSNHN